MQVHKQVSTHDRKPYFDFVQVRRRSSPYFTQVYQVGLRLVEIHQQLLRKYNGKFTSK